MARHIKPATPHLQKMAHDVSESLRQSSGQSMSERISPPIGQSVSQSRSQSRDSTGARAAETREGRRVFANRVSATANSRDGSVVFDRFTVGI